MNSSMLSDNQNPYNNKSTSSNHSLHNTSLHSLNQSFQVYQKSQPIMFPLNISQNLAFNNSNQDYVITVEATEERVTLLVEDRFDISMWRGDFTSKYIEEITKKTGKERSYQTFMQMLVGTIQNQKGFSQFYIDLMGFQELQLLKAKRGGADDYSQMSQVKNNKKYLILTHLISNSGNGNSNSGVKVHYPLPLNPVETGTYMMDKETMKRMVKRMSQTLTEFKQMNTTGSQMGGSQANQSNGFSTNGFNSMSNINNNIGRQTAKEFFSKENLMHPVVEENATLKQKLKQLEQAKGMGGAVSLNSLQVEKQKLEQDFQSYQVITQKEIKKLRNLKQELQRRIDETKTEIQSERPQSAYSQLSLGGGGNMMMQNQTMTSNFNQSQLINEVEDLRRQLAEVSVELEETKDNYKKRLILQQKDMEEYYDQLSTFRQEEKALRVKVNQLEIELEHNIKRLDIICKSKGLPRPKRRSASGTSSTNGKTYVSPYRINGTSSQNSNSNARNLSNGSRKASPFTRNNYQYTPPNRRNQSPGNFSNGSNSNSKFRTSPMNNNYINTNYSANSNSQRMNRINSPGARQNGSSGSKTGGTTTTTTTKSTTQNRLYSPSGRIRTNSNGSGTNIYGSNPTGGPVNRVRRDPAVGGGSGTYGSRSNSRTRAVDGTISNNRTNSNQRNTSLTNNKNLTNVQQRKHQSSQITSYVRQQPSKSLSQQQQLQQDKKTSSSLFNNSKSTNQKSTILDQQKVVNGTIDEKIEKLQSLLKQAKTTYQ